MGKHLMSIEFGQLTYYHQHYLDVSFTFLIFGFSPFTHTNMASSSSQGENNTFDEERNKNDIPNLVIIFDDEDVQEGIYECPNNVIRKLITNKTIYKAKTYKRG